MSSAFYIPNSNKKDGFLVNRPTHLSYGLVSRRCCARFCKVGFVIAQGKKSESGAVVGLFAALVVARGTSGRSRLFLSLPLLRGFSPFIPGNTVRQTQWRYVHTATG
jgi:hypothetical protein